MPSSYKAIDLFGPGPQRFVLGPLGQHMVPRLSIGTHASGLVTVGPEDVLITIRGRLVSWDPELVWAQLDAIRAMLEDFETPGTLIDLRGREYENMTFARFEPGDRVDTGRWTSLAYTALFHRPAA